MFLLPLSVNGAGPPKRLRGTNVGKRGKILPGRLAKPNTHRSKKKEPSNVGNSSVDTGNRLIVREYEREADIGNRLTLNWYVSAIAGVMHDVRLTLFVVQPVMPIIVYTRSSDDSKRKKNKKRRRGHNERKRKGRRKAGRKAGARANVS